MKTYRVTTAQDGGQDNRVCTYGQMFNRCGEPGARTTALFDGYRRYTYICSEHYSAGRRDFIWWDV